MPRTALLGLISLTAALALDLSAASAQSGGYPLYPWCASYGGGRGGGTNCYFSTWDQCRQAASGNGGYCYRNTWYDAYGPYYSFGGHGAASPAIIGPSVFPAPVATAVDVGRVGDRRAGELAAPQNEWRLRAFVVREGRHSPSERRASGWWDPGPSKRCVPEVRRRSSV